MTDEQRKMIDKLNEDNRKLNDVNKGMKDYAYDGKMVRV